MTGIPLAQPTLDGLGLTSANSPNASASAAAPAHSNAHLIRSHDTGSQVCNLLFSQLTSELVSTHGYSQHAINIWKYPSMNQVTLRFWDVFGKREKSGNRGIVGEWGVIR
ncbi:hypothetical protein KC346_g12548 [Hortaea werneckii]|nr:hypothetical protein KC346_g12548 [Hortaea werneckii]